MLDAILFGAVGSLVIFVIAVMIDIIRKRR